MPIRADKPSLNETAWLAVASYGDCKACGKAPGEIFVRCAGRGHEATAAPTAVAASGRRRRGTKSARTQGSTDTSIRMWITTRVEDADEAVEGIMTSRRIVGARHQG